MDFQNRAGSKPGSAGVASQEQSNIDRRERLRRLALETIDLSKDPYFMRNHLGTYECKLCMTLHSNEGSYLAHTQGKKHQSNLGRRAHLEAVKNKTLPPLNPMNPVNQQRQQLLKMARIGRPGYHVTKRYDTYSGQYGLLFQIIYPDLDPFYQPPLLTTPLKAGSHRPRHRFMSAYEQRIETPLRQWRYLIFSGEPYEPIAFKIPARELDDEKGFSFWDRDSKTYSVQVVYKGKEVPGTVGMMIAPNPT